MRIQHNIPAMNSLVNYTRNNNALAKNLEKLSSGYRINSAADDAAGLAISEKMRSQIAGLEKAQDNANDGISLVQVAEGALTEVNSMLTRLTELATQSANGTFEDGVDRVNIQEETNAILEEIDRISKATNFNGINLLDGSLSEGAKITSTNSFELPKQGVTLGTDTIVHNDGGAGVDHGTTFSVDLHDYTFKNDSTGPDEMTITIGEGTDYEVSVKLTGDGNGAMSAEDIVAAIVDSTNSNVAWSDKSGNVTASAGTETGTVALTINGQAFTVSDGGDGRLTFKQDAAPTKATEVVDGAMSVKVEGVKAEAASATKGEYRLKLTGVASGNNKSTEFDIEFKDADDTTNTTTTITFTGDNGGTVADTMDKLKAAILASTDTTAGGKKISDLFDVTIDNDEIVLTSKTEGASGGKIVSFGNDNSAGGSATLDYANASITDGADGVEDSSQTYNVQTTAVDNIAMAGSKALASTYITLKDDMVADGASIRIGEERYVFKTDADSDIKADTTNGEVLVDVSDLDAEADDYIDKVAQRLSLAAADNEAFTVGTEKGKDGKITIVEKEGQTVYTTNGTKGNLNTVEDIANKLDYSGAAKTGKSLILQIGDTNADYQHVSVDVADMSSKGLGINGLDLSNQKSAGEAIATIKNAVNTVSMQRGKLGALQNRLDHTLNNLETTTTNISASESQIRDVNMAKEMTAYTKNNILAQAAQSMLAQANSMPQGVLQLLQ